MNTMLGSAEKVRNFNILLVEDDDGDAKAVSRAFRKNRIANPITRAADGVEALEMLRGSNGREKISPPHILFIDLNMPRMGGLALIREIRNDPELSRAIIFVLTTSSDDEDIAKSYDYNVAGYMDKEKVGQDFFRMAGMIETYWSIVELPPARAAAG